MGIKKEIIIGSVVIVGLVLLILFPQKTYIQTFSPECVSDDECKVGIALNYCSVDYSCTYGKCIVNQHRCPEVCHNELDDDFDNLSDCKDPDCYLTNQCPCSAASFDDCLNSLCFCEESKKAFWTTTPTDHFCECK